MTIKEALNRIYTRYKLSPLDAEILLSLSTGKPKEYILAHPEKNLTKFQLKKYISFTKRRSTGEPIAYITKKKEFFGLEFFVNRNVLIPRPETELLVESLLEKISNAEYEIPDTILDVGTGSGNIIISIVKNIPKKIQNRINFIATDISKKVLGVAKENAKRHNVSRKIKFIQSNLLEYFLKNNKMRSRNFFIVANLPYVSPNTYDSNKNNLKYEPAGALISSEKGLMHYKNLFREIKNIWQTNHGIGITGFFEISPEQKPEIGRIIRKILPNIRTIFRKDLAGRWRCLELRIQSESNLEKNK